MDATPRGATLSRILRSISPLRSNTMGPRYVLRPPLLHTRRAAPLRRHRLPLARRAIPLLPLASPTFSSYRPYDVSPPTGVARQSATAASPSISRRTPSPPPLPRRSDPAAPPQPRGLTASSANFDPPIAPRRRLPRAGKLIHAYTQRNFSVR